MALTETFDIFLAAYLIVGSVVFLSLGSFLGGLVYRLPLYYQGRTYAGPKELLWGRSECPACGAPLSLWQLVPLVSWLALGRRCGHCRAAIPGRYALCEALSLLSFLAAVWLGGHPVEQISLAALGATLVAIALIDLRSGVMPDALTATLALLGVIRAVLPGPIGPNALEALAGAAAGAGILWLVRAAYSRLRGAEGLGMGDVKFMGMAGIWIGWQGLGTALFLAASATLAVVALRGLRGGEFDARTAVPFGPGLCLALYAVVAGRFWPL